MAESYCCNINSSEVKFISAFIIGLQYFLIIGVVKLEAYRIADRQSSSDKFMPQLIKHV